MTEAAASRRRPRGGRGNLGRPGVSLAVRQERGFDSPFFSTQLENTMTAITASMVAELRAKTDAPMMECKKALTEAAGNMEKAEELLRVKLGSKAGKAASRITAEGVVAASVAGTTGALVEVNCETDFVSKNDSFLAFTKAVAERIAKNNPADVAALSALPYSQDGFGPTLDDVRKGL